MRLRSVISADEIDDGERRKEQADHDHAYDQHPPSESVSVHECPRDHESGDAPDHYADVSAEERGGGGGDDDEAQDWKQPALPDARTICLRPLVEEEPDAYEHGS